MDAADGLGPNSAVAPRRAILPELTADRLLADLKAAAGDNEAFVKAQESASRGDYSQAAHAAHELARLASPATPNPKRIPSVVAPYPRRIALALRCDGKQPRFNEPVTLSVADIRKSAPTST